MYKNKIIQTIKKNLTQYRKTTQKRKKILTEENNSTFDENMKKKIYDTIENDIMINWNTMSDEEKNTKLQQLASMLSGSTGSSPSREPQQQESSSEIREGIFDAFKGKKKEQQLPNGVRRIRIRGNDGLVKFWKSRVGTLILDKTGKKIPTTSWDIFVTPVKNSPEEFIVTYIDSPENRTEL